MIHCLDTHALIWLWENPRKLGSQGRKILLESEDMVVVPAIVLAEAFGYVVKTGEFYRPQSVIDELVGKLNCIIAPFDSSVFLLMPHDLDISDAMIVATALEAGRQFDREVALITADERIAASGHIRTVW